MCRLAVAAGLGVIAIAPAMATKRYVVITAIEPKGGATIDKEPVPNTPLPEGKGYVLKQPDQSGRWEVSVYVFDPRQVLIKMAGTVDAPELECHLVALVVVMPRK